MNEKNDEIPDDVKEAVKKAAKADKPVAKSPKLQKFIDKGGKGRGGKK
jgi:hypothetical protein